MYTTDKRNIRRAFSRSSNLYEELSSLHKDIGLRLLDGLDISGAELKMLDIGMGTGWLALKTREKFPNAQITGMDFARGMADYAKNKNKLSKVVLGDACALPFRDKSFDMVLSNLAYQWIQDLQGVFGLTYSVLKEEGVFSLSCFGGDTLKELFSSFEESNKKDNRNSVLDKKIKIKKRDIEHALIGNSFKDIKVYSQSIKVHFSDLFDLVKWLKNIGANGVRQETFINRSWFLRADDFYKRNFRDNGQIFATFEVIWARARR